MASQPTKDQVIETIMNCITCRGIDPVQIKMNLEKSEIYENMNLQYGNPTPEPIDEKLIRLAKKVNEIVENTALSWEAKYDLILSDEYSGEINKIISFQWYDPDTSYQEDVCAYVTQMNNHINP